MVDEQQKQEHLAFARRVLDGFPRSVDDLMWEEWPDDPEAQPQLIIMMAEMVRDQSHHRRWRRLAFDHLQRRVEHYRRMVQSGGDFRPEDIPYELLAWSFQVMSGMVTPPAAGRGQKEHDGDTDLRDDKLLVVYEFLRRDCGYKSDDAHELLEEAAYIAPDTLRDALRRARRRARSVPSEDELATEPEVHVNIWGDEIP